MQKGGWVYIMADRYRGGLYLGVTADLVRRVQQHRDGTGSAHVLRYGLNRIVHAEQFDEILAAISREKLLKRWRRDWKFALIEAHNPNWRDLWDEWFPAVGVPEQRDPGSSPG